MPVVKQLRSAKVSDNLEEASPPQQGEITPTSPSDPKSRRLERDSLENLDADPWGSPAMLKSHTHEVNNEATPSNNVTAAMPIGNGLMGPTRTTSAFTTHADVPPSKTSPVGGNGSQDPPTDESGGWASYGASGNDFQSPRQSGLSGEGYNGDNRRSPSGDIAGRSIGGRHINRGGGEIITVTLLPDKEGMFMFQHRNYEVNSVKRSSSVIRRYSDFVWLLDCLHKKYPFRQLPLLPPKRVAGEVNSHL